MNLNRRSRSKRVNDRGSVLGVEFLEPRQMLAADLPSSQIYEPGIDPTIGASISAFGQMADSDDIQIAFEGAISEMVSEGFTEISIAATRTVDPRTGQVLNEADITPADPNIPGDRGRNVVGPDLDTIAATVAFAKQQGLHVTIQPMFELEVPVDFQTGEIVAEGHPNASNWRADFIPVDVPGNAIRQTFGDEYVAFIGALGAIRGVDRIDFGSELNDLVRTEYDLVAAGAPESEHILVRSLDAVEQSGFAGEVGYVATVEDYESVGADFLWNLEDSNGQRRLDYLGINTYYIDWRTIEQFNNNVPLEPETSILYRNEESLVAGTGDVPGDVVDLMHRRWDIALDQIEEHAATVGLPVFIQEVGLVRRDLTSIATSLVEPTRPPAEGPSNEAIDSAEMKAYYEAYLRAMDGRGDVINAAHAWTWEHSADLASRDLSLPICEGPGSVFGANGQIQCQLGWYEIWPEDGGGGEALVSFIATANDPVETDDIVGHQGARNLWVSKSDGSQFLNSFGGRLREPEFLQVGDFNGDGIDDVAGFRENNGRWRVGISNGDDFDMSTWATWSTDVDWKNVVTGDFNGDGLDDIAGQVEGSRDVWILRSTGDSFQSVFGGRWRRDTNWIDVQVGDFNGDGQDDLVGRYEPNNRWDVMQSVGNRFRSSKWGKWRGNVEWVDISVGDFNNDGLDDVMGRGNSRNAVGEWWYLRSTGSQFQSIYWADWNPTRDWLDVQFADFDGDGRTDIAGRDAATGGWYITTDRFRTIAPDGSEYKAHEYWGQWNVTNANGAVSWVDVRAADVNGDGRADLIGRDEASGTWWASISNGDSFDGAFYWGQWNPNATWNEVLVGNFG